MKIQDGKHFLKFYIVRGEVRGEVLCVANPERDEAAECRMAKDYPECLVKYSWANLGPDMLATPHHAIDRVLVWTSPLPIVYEGEGSGEDYEDWIIPDLNHTTSPLKMRELMEALVSEDAT